MLLQPVPQGVEFSELDQRLAILALGVEFQHLHRQQMHLLVQRCDHRQGELPHPTANQTLSLQPLAETALASIKRRRGIALAPDMA